MFSDEGVQSRFQLLALLRWTLQRSDRSFALSVRLVKTRIQTDWWYTMDLFEGLMLVDRRLTMTHHAYQELCCHLHLLGVYTSSG